MRDLGIKILIISIFLCNNSAVAQEKVWTKFVKNPSESNFQACQRQIDTSLEGNLPSLDSPTFIQLTENCTIGKVLRLIKHGNPYAIELGFHFRPLFRDAPALMESINISLGTVICTNPELFLKLYRDYVFRTSQDYKEIGILSNLGPEFVDEPEKREIEFAKRVDCLRSVTNKNLTEVRDHCLKNL